MESLLHDQVACSASRGILGFCSAIGTVQRDKKYSGSAPNGLGYLYPLQEIEDAVVFPVLEALKEAQSHMASARKHDENTQDRTNAIALVVSRLKEISGWVGGMECDFPVDVKSMGSDKTLSSLSEMMEALHDRVNDQIPFRVEKGIQLCNEIFISIYGQDDENPNRVLMRTIPSNPFMGMEPSFSINQRLVFMLVLKELSRNTHSKRAKRLLVKLSEFPSMWSRKLNELLDNPEESVSLTSDETITTYNIRQIVDYLNLASSRSHWSTELIRVSGYNPDKELGKDDVPHLLHLNPALARTAVLNWIFSSIPIDTPT